MTEHKDRDAVNITTPVVGLLRGTPSRQHRTDRHLSSNNSPAGPDGRNNSPSAECVPLVQAVETVAAGVAGFVVGAGDISVE